MKRHLISIIVLALIMSLFFVSCKNDTPSVREYTVTLDYGDGFEKNVVRIKEGETYTLPSAPEREGYYLDLYTDDSGNEYREGSTVRITGDICFTAKWTDMPTVTFLNGDELFLSVSLNSGDSVTEPTKQPVKDGYSFRWWNLNGTKYDFSSPVKSNLTLQAVWKDESKVEVRVVEEEGKESLFYIEKGSAYTTHSSITRNGYEFKGWNLNGGDTLAAETEIAAVTKDITLTAVWSEEKYSVEFQYEDGTSIKTYTDLKWGEIITPPSSDEVTIPQGKKIYYWFNDSGIPVTADSVPFTVKSDLVITPVFINKTLTVTFDYGTVKEYEEVSYAGNTNSREIYKKGYKLDYWHLENETTAFDFKNTVITEDITLYAEWREIADVDKLTVTLVSDDPVQFNEEFILEKGDGFYMDQTKLFTLIGKESEGYSIVSWNYTDGTEAVDQELIQRTFTADTTLYAVWEKEECTVEFDLNGGEYTDSEGNTCTSIADETVYFGETVKKPECELTKDGYEFIGWSLNGGTIYDFSTPVRGDITLDALWKADEGNLTINYNDGITPDTVKSYSRKTRFRDIDIKDPVRSGYIFAGWYYSKDGTDSVNSSDLVVSEDRTIYAQWTETDTYTVEYRDASLESVIYTETVEAGKKAVGYTAPQIEGMKFRGWFKNTDGELSFAGESFDFTSPVEENMTLMAGYTVDESWLTGSWSYTSYYSFVFDIDENGRKTVTFICLGDTYKEATGTWDYVNGTLTMSLNGSVALELAGIKGESSIPSYEDISSMRCAKFIYHYANDDSHVPSYKLYESQSDSSSITCTGGHDNWGEILTVTPDSFLDIRKCAYNGVTVAELKVEETSDSVKADLQFSLLIPYSADTLVIEGLYGDYYQDVVLTKVK